ncbi:hypothetical protein MBLNU457_7128t1 [Dothideomycetes sp. NU457]
MPKRKASDALEVVREDKRVKNDPIFTDRISHLSHEITLRVLSFLPVPDLIVCHRVSRHFHALSADSQLWKALYYNRYVQPRAARLPGIRESGVPADSLYFSSKLSRWLDDEGLVRRGKDTNWKRQYKLRHNWSNGSCAVSEIPVSEQPSVPPILVQMNESTIFLADQSDGLRAWSIQGTRKLLATFDLTLIPGYDWSPPTSLAVDTAAGNTDTRNVAIGFQNGSFSIVQLDLVRNTFARKYSHPASSNGMLGAIALSSPYLSTMTATQLLSFYKFDDLQEPSQGEDILGPPRLLHSLHSNTVWPPFTLSIRPSTDSILVAIAYALPTYLSGWTVGIQEMRVCPDTGDLLSSRLASAIDQQYRSLMFPQSTTAQASAAPPFSYFGNVEANQIHSKPTSLSYTHPYLLVSHPDNTLTLYLVSSTNDTLAISPGNRLWGHTSSVSGAHVGGRGKAISVSSRGDELRVWELEGGFTSASAKRKLQAGGLSVQIRPDAARRSSSVHGHESKVEPGVAKGSSLGLALKYGKSVSEDTSMIRGWVGFDEENVVVLKEKTCGGQSLVVYDFA